MGNRGSRDRRQADGGAGQGAQAVAGEVDHQPIGMAGDEAARMRHVGRGEQVDVGPGFDLLAHQARRPELRRRHPIRPGREAA